MAAVAELFAADPAGALLALAQVVQQGVVLPGACMDDAGWHKQHNSSRAGRGGSSAAAAEQQGARQGQLVAHPAASQLYIDALAAADIMGLHTLNDAADAVEQACELWKVLASDASCWL